MPNRHSPGCRCCGPNCTAFKDTFTAISGDWTQDAGTWSISSDTLTTSDSDAELARDVLSYVSGEQDYYIKFKASDGDILKFYDAPNTEARDTLVVVVGTGGKVQSLDESSVLFRECSATIPADEWVTLRIKCQEYVYINGVEVMRLGIHELESIRVVGTGAISGTVYFDDYEGRFVASVDHPSCPSCGGFCDPYPNGVVVPVTFEISGATDRWNGTYWEYYSRLNGIYEAAELNSPFDCFVKVSGLDIDVVEEIGSEVNIETMWVNLVARSIQLVKDGGGGYFTYDKNVGDPGDFCSGNLLTLPDNGPSLTEVGVAIITVP